MYMHGIHWKANWFDCWMTHPILGIDGKCLLYNMNEQYLVWYTHARTHNCLCRIRSFLLFEGMHIRHNEIGWRGAQNNRILQKIVRSRFTKNTFSWWRFGCYMRQKQENRKTKSVCMYMFVQNMFVRIVRIVCSSYCGLFVCQTYC